MLHTRCSEDVVVVASIFERNLPGFEDRGSPLEYAWVHNPLVSGRRVTVGDDHGWLLQCHCDGPKVRKIGESGRTPRGGKLHIHPQRTRKRAGLRAQ